MSHGEEDLEALRAEIDSRDWYHTLELAPGLETPGWFDLRGIAPSIPFPDSLTGLRCLDVGSFDGFWAFEMERRGAASVVAVDVLDPRNWDWPAGSSEETIAAIGTRKGRGGGFEVARSALRSSVERQELSIYDLDPELIGKFDLVYIGSLLLHLRDPVGGLMRVREVCEGTLIVADVIDLARTRLLRRSAMATLEAAGRPWWWKPNLRGLVRMIEAAGFELERKPGIVFMKPGAGHPPRRLAPRALLNPFGREETFRAWRGDPHGVVVARPA